MINKPAVAPGVDFVNLSWRDLELRVMAEHIDESSAELRFFSGNGSGESLLHVTRANILSTSAMHNLTKRLERHSQNIQWEDVLTHVTEEVLKIARRVEPAEEIWPSEEDTLEVEYLLEPLLYLNHPAVVFGEYGSLKSVTALAIAYIVQLPYHDNTLGLTTSIETSKCLYLDYEDDPSSFRRRWSALERGFGKGVMPILYKRMIGTLADSVEEMRQIITNKDIKLLIVDSLGPAARGNLNDPEPAIKYHAALRQLGTTSLTLAHTSKDQLTKKRTIFGSVFFTNLARSVWECKAEQEIGEDEAIISLKHTKANLSRLHPPLGYKFTFTNNTINITKAELRNTGLSGELPLPWQIKNLLRVEPLTHREIAEALTKDLDTIKTTLTRMAKSKGGKPPEVVKLPDHRWGLQAYES